MTSGIDEAAVLEALKVVVDPDLHRDIVSLGFVKQVRIEDGGNEALETIVRLNFISSNYDWVVNTSVADVTSNPVTTNPIDTSNSSVISPVDNHVSESIDTISQIGSTTEPTMVPLTSIGQPGRELPPLSTP